jgi:hypothetical protein
MVLYSVLLNIHICFIINVLSAVGIATGYGLDGREVGVRVLVVEIFIFSTRHRDRF